MTLQFLTALIVIAVTSIFLYIALNQSFNLGYALGQLEAGTKSLELIMEAHSKNKE
jgi:hypothetical protein